MPVPQPPSLPIVGVDVGGTKLLAVRLDPDGGVIADPVQASPTNGPGLVQEVAAAARRLAGAAGPGAVGVGVPGLVDSAGTVRFAPNLPGLVGTPITQALAEALPGWQVWVGNDATAAGWGEHARGAARRADEVLVITLGTGIGGAIISEGRLIEGSNRYAGEFGHMVVDPHGPRCPCGKQGCWERFASGSGLGALAREMAIAGGAPRLVDAGRRRRRIGARRACHGRGRRGRRRRARDHDPLRMVGGPRIWPTSPTPSIRASSSSAAG